MCQKDRQFEGETIRSAAAERSTSLRMHSRNVQLPQSIDDARRALVGTFHHRLDLRAGARRVEPKPQLFALREKVRIRHGGGERSAQRGQALDRNAGRYKERPAERERRKRRLHHQPVVVAGDKIGGEWHVMELGELFRPVLHDDFAVLSRSHAGRVERTELKKALGWPSSSPRSMASSTSFC